MTGSVLITGSSLSPSSISWAITWSMFSLGSQNWKHTELASSDMKFRGIPILVELISTNLDDRILWSLSNSMTLTISCLILLRGPALVTSRCTPMDAAIAGRSPILGTGVLVILNPVSVSLGRWKSYPPLGIFNLHTGPSFLLNARALLNISELVMPDSVLYGSKLMLPSKLWKCSLKHFVRIVW